MSTVKKNTKYDMILTYEDWINENYQIDEGFIDSISDGLHLLGDIAAGVGDVIIPGSGAVIDVINMLSYFVESTQSSDQNTILKLILSGTIQAFAIFDPFNLISNVKLGLNKIFNVISTKTLYTLSSISQHILSVKNVFTTILSKLTTLTTKVFNALSDSKFTDAIAWLSEKLNIPNVLNWLKKIFTVTIPSYIRKFLELLAKLNPTSIGANSAESSEFLTKQFGKITIDIQSAKQFNQLAYNFASTWNSGIAKYKNNTNANSDNPIGRDSTQRYVPNIITPISKS